MGWHYTLTFTCTVLPAFEEFVTGKLLQRFADYDGKWRWYEAGADGVSDDVKEAHATYEGLTKKYRDLIDIWDILGIGNCFKEYTYEGGVLRCELSKKVTWHDGCLKSDFEVFMKDVIAPLSSVISECTIESDDYGDAVYHYTDAELRGIYFRLKDKIKSLKHEYSEDGSGDIVATRIVYKHSIPRAQLLDLDRAYGIA